jgi:hypothetical protein
LIERVGSHIARELARFGPASGLAPLIEAWPTAVGGEIARNAWPARLARNGTLYVNASSSAWAFELAQLEGRIREALGELAPPRLRFAVGPLPEAVHTGPEEPPRAPVEPSPEQVRQAEALASQIEDENLRKVVAKAASLSLASARSSRSFW